MRVRFEPIGEEIECASDESVLDAAFRQGYNLAYGCREGQCSACKCFLMEGEVALKPYSNFALSDTEHSNGYSLMCRAMPEQDLVIELLHYDRDSYRLENPIRDGVAVVEAVEALTHDITRLELRVTSEDFSFLPGQYVDLWVPGVEDGSARRSFSLANLPGDGRIELMIKRYPRGRLSGMLDGQIQPGLQISFTGPYGAFHLRRSDRPVLMIAGGSGMAPILGILRQLADEGCSRPVRFFYGARAERDLFYVDQISQLGSRLADFEFTPILSDTEGFVHEAVDKFLASDAAYAEPDVYMCGPPPMLEAAEPMLIDGHGISEQRIFQDKFTTAAEADPSRTAGAADSANGGPPVKRVGAVSEAGVDESERQFGWYQPAKRRATLYEDVTIDTQPSIHRHLIRGWPVSFEDGRGTWNESSTALQASDWFAFRDPSQQWERPYYQTGTAVEQQIEGAMRSATEEGLMEDYSAEWIEFLRRFLQVPAYVEHGLWFAMATAGRDCLSDSVATCVCLQAAMKQRSAQAIVLYAMDLEDHFSTGFTIEGARDAFLNDEPWQPTRRYLERLAATRDWGEVIVAANLCFEPLVGTLLRRELGMRAAAPNGDTVTPVLARVETQEWEWARAWTTELMRFLIGDTIHGAANRSAVGGWVRDWLVQAMEAAEALAPLASLVPQGFDPEQALTRVNGYAGELLEEAGMPELCELVGHQPASLPESAAQAATAAPVRRVRPRGERRREVTAAGAGSSDVEVAPVPSPAEGEGDGTYDYVGIVMAKSAEGDAVAEILSRREDVAVHEQPAFWDIRARDRLVIPYDDVSEELGYEIDAYSIQHEMSTHYGRMVASDDALMLFSDPTEAMEHLMS
jgi:NAD(P)H-flavin reductase/ferredoxin